MESGQIKRKEVPFSQVSNSAIRDTELSLKAKGLYSLIQSYITIPNFTLYKTTLLKQCKESENTFDSAWKELKIKGYLVQYKKKDVKTKKFFYEYELLDVKVEATPQKATLGKSTPWENGLYSNTDLNNTDLNNNYKKTNTDFLNKNHNELFYYKDCEEFLDNIFFKVNGNDDYSNELNNAEEMLRYFYHKFYNKYKYPMTTLTEEQEQETADIINNNLGYMEELSFCYYYVDYYLEEKRSKTAKDPNKKYHSFIQFIKGLDFEMMSQKANQSGVNDIDFSYKQNIS